MWRGGFVVFRGINEFPHMLLVAMAEKRRDETSTLII